MSGHKTAIVIEDDDQNARFLAVALASVGVDALRVSTPDDAVQALKCQKLALVFLSVNLGTSSEIDAIRYIRLMDQQIPIIVLAALGDEVEKCCINAGASHFLTKPAPIAELTKIGRSVSAITSEPCEVD